MKYYFVVFAVFLAGSAYAQQARLNTDVKLNAEVQIGNSNTVKVQSATAIDGQAKPFPGDFRGPGQNTNQMPPEKRMMERREDMVGQMKDPSERPAVADLQTGLGGPKPVEMRLENRVRALTDVNANPINLIGQRFNVIQQKRLENAGMINEKREEKREMLIEKFEEKKAQWEQKRVKLAEAKEEKISEIADNVIERLDNAIARLENTDQKIQAYITTETSAEIVTSLENANLLLEEAKSSVEVVRSELSVELSNDTGLSKEALKELINQAKEDVKSAWDAYKEVISLIKE